MDGLNKKLTEARKKLQLSIEEVSEKTKIRPHIIKALESGDYGNISPVYIKSFLKTYSAFLKIPVNEEINFEKIAKPSEKINNIDEKFSIIEDKPSKKKEKKIIISDIDDDSKSDSDFAEIFRKKKSLEQKSNIVNYLIYTALALALIGLLYFTFFSRESNIPRPPEPLDKSGKTQDTTIIQTAEKTLFSLFESTDSLTLEASATDTAWLKIDIDGKQQQEILMLPGMSHKWGANNYFIITQGNVGAVKYMRNGIPLESFGSKGSVVKNIKITKTEITGLSPWGNKQDTSTTKSNYEYKKRPPKKQPEKKIKLIEPSPLDSKVPLKKKFPN